jgi:hypothetical protein
MMGLLFLTLYFHIIDSDMHLSNNTEELYLLYLQQWLRERAAMSCLKYDTYIIVVL